MKKKNWYPLDNAAKIYPPVSNYRRASTFAIRAVMSEEVDKDILQRAVDSILTRFETFDVKLKRGIFWYYLERNNKPFWVEKEQPYFLRYINQTQNNDYLFKVYYNGKIITLSVFHSLCDGGGAMDVFKAILFEYLLLKGADVKTEGKVLSCTTPFTESESTDAFSSAYTKPKVKLRAEKSAFKTDGTSFSTDGCGIITGKVNYEQLRALTKKYNATITVYLASLYLTTIYNVFIKNKKQKNKLVTLLVPVNMRKWYDSKTLRNFAMFIRLRHDYTTPITLEECIESCKKQMEEELTKDKLDATIYNNVKVEKNWLLKFCPLFLKDIAMRLAYKRVGDNLHTANISNLGMVDLPQSMQPFIEDMTFILSPSYSCKSHMAVLGFKDSINITFSREFVENNVEREFFTHLSANGVEVEVSSNYWEAK